ncbi:MAG: Mth938-like domain-containing protein [Candidatus Sedimenticola sp. (ex Thyasira tokunagai)]
MKFSLADPSLGNTIHSYSERGVVIDSNIYDSSVIVLPDKIIAPWGPTSLKTVEMSDFSILDGLNPDLVILGTGERQQFLSPALYQSLIRAGIGVEIMTTPAACRTYNILLSEGRRAAAALLLK